VSTLVLLLEVNCAISMDLALDGKFSDFISALALDRATAMLGLEFLEGHLVLDTVLLVVAFPNASLALLLVNLGEIGHSRVDVSTSCVGAHICLE